ncbi:hypothetical protein TNIN_440881 [Trichonephila inaurata madagascariensis]|uniref:BTB domain-containing protein n=1 Tax=Trichonephila inaurata madagascariensis TaxID=2747483 RepID=A0A8X7CFH9_9ARAC|nr:hypothetical protein TNIN_483871 [Trichonephila inaurata madagascariensis]GFY70354.1 hypothetical protein TNIN_440881 [Trichonephila inaurata madagascariensis]
MVVVADAHREPSEHDSAEEDVEVESAEIYTEPQCKYEANIDYLLWTELGELKSKDKCFYTEVEQFSGIQKIYGERKRIEDLIYEKDKTVGELHTADLRGDLKLFDTEEIGSVSHGYQTDCESPTILEIELKWEKIYDTKDTFRLSVRLHRRDMKGSPIKVNLTTSMESENGVELAYINFESLACSDEDVSTIMMSTEKQVDCIPDKAKYKILLMVSGCCGQTYSCPEIWPTSKTPRTECKYKTLQKDLDMAKSMKYFADVELECGIETYKANKLILCSRSELLKLISEQKDLTNELATNSVQLSRRCCANPEVVNEYLKFLYSGDCKDLTAKNAIQLYIFADDQRLEGLKLICRTTLMTNITISNFVDIWFFSRLRKEKALTETLLKYAEKHKEEIIEFCEKHKEIHKAEIKELFKSIDHDKQLSEADELAIPVESSKIQENVIHSDELRKIIEESIRSAQSSKEMMDEQSSLDETVKKLESLFYSASSQNGIN